jgi:hypothetical protein
MTKQAAHDLGGVEPDASAAIDRTDHPLTDFDKSVDATFYLLSRPGSRIMTVDELRRAIEAIPPPDYRRLGYYERWLTAIAALLVEKGTLSRGEIDAKIAALRGAA